MKNLIKISLLCLLLFTVKTASSQVLISLVFGKALNTPKIEFGLNGGWNRSYMLDLPDAEPLDNFNIGFYFFIMMGESQKHFLSTGVQVKSNVGATGLPTYPLGDAAFDSLYAGGTLTKKVHYFYVPIKYQYRLKERWLLEAGVQLGLRNKANDIFDVDELNGDLTYTTSTKDEYKHLDAGLVGGIGYKLKKELKSTAVGVNYYYGLMDVSETSTTIKNSSIYVYVNIPIGVPKPPSTPKK
jgi:hypothetical protein